MFSKIDHILGHKGSRNKFTKIEITPWFISDQNRIKLDLNNKGNSRKYSNTWGLNYTDEKPMVTKIIREEIKSSKNSMKVNIQATRICGTHKGYV
jgi:hypothetical protein